MIRLSLGSLQLMKQVSLPAVTFRYLLFKLAELGKALHSVKVLKRQALLEAAVLALHANTSAAPRREKTCKVERQGEHFKADRSWSYQPNTPMGFAGIGHQDKS